MPLKLKAVLGLPLVVLVAAVIHAQTPPSEEAPAPPAPAPPAAPGEAAPGRSAAGNPIAELEKAIAGHEKEPSGTFFKNVQILKQVPAGQLLDVMRMGFSRSLGVRCSHCHVMGQWDKDDKTEKQTTRAMLKMTATINNDLLKNIKGIHESALVTCTTCHRGQSTPATVMEGQGDHGRPQPRPGANPPGR